MEYPKVKGGNKRKSRLRKKEGLMGEQGGREVLKETQRVNETKDEAQDTQRDIEKWVKKDNISEQCYSKSSPPPSSSS